MPKPKTNSKPATQKSPKKSESHLDTDHEVLEILTEEARNLRVTLQKLNSPWRRFGVGVLAGIGSAVGATIIAALIFFWLGRILQTVGVENLVPGLDAVIEQQDPNRQAIDRGE